MRQLFLVGFMLSLALSCGDDPDSTMGCPGGENCRPRDPGGTLEYLPPDAAATHNATWDSGISVADTPHSDTSDGIDVHRDISVQDSKVDAGLIQADGKTGADTQADSQTTDASSDANSDVSPSPDVKATPDAQVASTGCAALVDCATIDCLGLGPNCPFECFTDADPTEVAKAKAVINCYNSDCDSDECDVFADSGCVALCATQQCTTQLQACIDTGTTGAGNCAAGLDCSKECIEDSNAPVSCMSSCYDSLQAETQSELADLLPCLGQSLAGAVDVYTCYPPMLQCLSGESNGTETCLETYGCVNECGGANGDPFCIYDCIAQATQEAVDQSVSLLACMGSGTDSTGCIDQIVDCSEPSGTYTCDEMWNCVEACGGPTGTTCLFDCLALSSPQTAQEYQELIKCPFHCDQECAGETTCMFNCLKTTCYPMYEKCYGFVVP